MLSVITSNASVAVLYIFGSRTKVLSSLTYLFLFSPSIL